MSHQYTRVVGVAPEVRDVTGFVIGKGGHNINRIQEESGAKSVFYERSQSQFVVKGGVSSVDRAVAMIEKCMADGVVHSDRRRNWRRPSYPRSQTQSQPDPAPATQTRRQTGFGVLAGLSGMTMEEYNDNQAKVRAAAEATVEVERLRQEKMDAEIDADWISHHAKENASRLRRVEMEVKIASGQKDFAERQKQYSGTAIMKPDICDEVLTTSLGRKSKSKMTSAKGQLGRTVGVNITAEILPSRVVDINALRTRNRAVAAAEKVSWQKRQDDWKQRNDVRKEQKNKSETEASTSLNEIVVSDRATTPAARKNQRRDEKRAELRAQMEFYPDADISNFEGQDAVLETVFSEVPIGYDNPCRMCNWNFCSQDCDDSYNFVKTTGGKSETENRSFTPDDEANVDTFLENLPAGWGVVA